MERHQITGHTELIGLLAYPIRHSQSPATHNAAYEKLGVDYPLKGVPAADPEETGRLSLAYFNRFMTEKEG